MRCVLLAILTVCVLSPGVFAQGATAGKAVSKRLVDQLSNPAYQKTLKRFFVPGRANKAAKTLEKKAATAVENLSAAQQVAALQVNNKVLQQQIARLRPQDKWGASVFRAVEEDTEKIHSFSGAVFKTTYNGQEEIYGVVAAHTIAADELFASNTLHKKFSVIMLIDGERKVFPVEVVQVSAPSMLDMALIKFRPQDEPFLKPFVIGNTLKKGEMLSSHGYMLGKETDLPRELLSETYLSLRTTMPAERKLRAGFCGSPVLNARQEMVGIHTGSSCSNFGEGADVGYVMSAKFLNVLVRAYHNGGKAFFPLQVAGHTLAHLNVDEFVTFIAFYDENMNLLWSYDFDGRFSQSKVEYAINGLAQARYVVTTARKVYWQNDGRILTENRGFSSQAEKQYKYDLWEKRPVDVK